MNLRRWGRGAIDSRRFLLAALLGVVILFGLSQFQIRSDPRPPGSIADIASLRERTDLNLVFVLVDTLRADHLGCYGYERATSPVMDYLASSGVRFARHQSQSSWTKTSMASLWTALNPVRTGVLRAQDALPQSARVPAEIFREAGFRTIGIWRNGWVAPNFGFDQGFDVYVNPTSGLSGTELQVNTRAGRVPSSDIDVVLAANEFLRTHHDQRFFLYLHMMDVHQYVTDQESAIFGTSYLDSYDNAIKWTDRQIGAVVAQIERLGLRQRTVIVIASDHGEAFGEHGSEGHARNLYSEVTTTPWIISLPFRLADGLIVSTGTSNVDVWPTLLDLFGLEPLEQVDGWSLRDRLTGEPHGPDDEKRLHYSQLDKTWGQVQARSDLSFAVNDDSFRLIRGAGSKSGDMLFDRERDPGEQSDVASDEPEIKAELSSQLEKHLGQRPNYQEIPHVELNDMELRQLRALGYVVQ